MLSRWVIGLLGLVLCGCADTPHYNQSYNFRVTIENISQDGQIAPGAYFVSSEENLLFTVGESDRGIGLETLAEDGDPLPLARAFIQMGVLGSVFNLDSVDYHDGAIGPGQSFVFEITAAPGQSLHLATMLGISNDSFYASDADGIELFSGFYPLPLTQVTDVALYDLGTEINEPLGEGANQPSRQPSPGSGDPEGGVVRTGDESYPQADELMHITVELIDANE